jgi:hypothetical protein
MPKGYLRSFAKVATLEEAQEIARALVTVLGDAATVESLLVRPYDKEEGWIEVTPTFCDFDIEAVKARLAENWVDGGECWVWNLEAHWNQGEGVRFAVPGIVWALVETIG